MKDLVKPAAVAEVPAEQAWQEVGAAQNTRTPRLGNTHGRWATHGRREEEKKMRNCVGENLVHIQKVDIVVRWGVRMYQHMKEIEVWGLLTSAKPNFF